VAHIAVAAAAASAFRAGGDQIPVASPYPGATPTTQVFS
jgi:hypothetical protein